MTREGLLIFRGGAADCRGFQVLEVGKGWIGGGVSIFGIVSIFGGSHEGLLIVRGEVVNQS